jgi:EAL and modified HD-GYP domain-containing signal transduction protein
MEFYIARQPIYNKDLQVIAYELLYRSGDKNNLFDLENDPDKATITVVLNTFLNVGIDALTNSLPGYINFTEKTLTSGVVQKLPKDYIGVEILESVKPTEEIISTCSDLHELGYLLILDDFAHNKESEKFIQYSGVIKMDFMSSTDEELKRMVKRYQHKGIKFVAEKVETREDFNKAVEYGYDYFQGYYFSKPSIVKGLGVNPYYASMLKILRMLQEEDCDYQEIASVINYYPTVTYSILRLANSVMYGGAHKIKSVLSALVRIGAKELKSWIMYIIAHGTNKNKPDELIKQSMIRARVAEGLCASQNLSTNVYTFSLMGLLSLMDVIMDTTMEELMSHIEIYEDVRKALTNPGEDMYSAAIQMIKAYEVGDFDGAEKYGNIIGVSLSLYQELYLEAIKRCDTVYNELVKTTKE